MTRANQPNRSPDYRKTYLEVRKLYDRIQSQDSCITYLLVELRAAQKRITKLEQHNDISATRRLKAAYAEVDKLEQRGDLPPGQAGVPKIGCSASPDGH